MTLAKKSSYSHADPALLIELDRVYFKGHRNILGEHKNTIEVTKESEVSKRGDCIIGVEASKGCADLSHELKEWIHDGGSLQIEIQVEPYVFVLHARGDRGLPLTDAHEIVIRRSDYISARTAAICCSKASIDIPRPIILKLQDPRTTGILVFRALQNDDGELTFAIP